MTASELEQLLIARLIRERGGTSQTWQRALGKVIVRDRETHPHCNWDVRLPPTTNIVDHCCEAWNKLETSKNRTILA